MADVEEYTYSFAGEASGEITGIIDVYTSDCENVNGSGWRVVAADGTIASCDDTALTTQEQYAQVTAVIAGGAGTTPEFGVVLRSTSNLSAGYYIVWARTSATLGTVTIYETSSFTNLASIVASAPINGTRALRAEATTNGSSCRIRVFIEDMTLPCLTFDDASPSTGTLGGCGGFSAVADGGAVTDVTIVTMSGGTMTGPIAPTEVRTGAVYDGTVELSWTNPPGTITGRKIEYAAQADPSATPSWTTFEDSSTTTASVAVTGLTNGTRYIFRVAMKTSSGTGQTALSINGETPRNAPRVVGVGAQVAVTTGTSTPTYPGGYTAVAGDYAVIAVAGLATAYTPIATPTGYQLLGSRFSDVSIGLVLGVFAFGKVLTASESMPAISVPAAWDGAAAGLSTQVVIVRDAHQTYPVEVGAVTSAAVAQVTFAPTGIRTRTANALILALVASADDNTLALDATTSPANDQNFSLPASYSTTTGGDHSIAIATHLGAVPPLATRAATADNLTAHFQPDATPTDTGNYQYRRTGLGGRVFVLDSGCRTDHVEFTGRLTMWVPTGSGWATTNNDSVTGNGHGTGVTSVVAGSTLGIASEASIVHMKVHNGTASSTTPTAAHFDEALDYIVANYSPPYIVNWSLVGYELQSNPTDYATISASLDTFAAAGGVVIVAIGNEANVYPQWMPDDHACAYDIGGTTFAGARDANSSVDPGMALWAMYGAATIATNTNSTSTATGASGTTYAAALVTGTAATIAAADPSLTAVQVMDLLLARSIKDGLSSIPTAYPNRALYTNADVPGLIGVAAPPTVRQTANGNDAWAALVLSLRSENAAVLSEGLSMWPRLGVRRH